MDAWKPEQYEKFKAERTRPFHDLMKLVEMRPGMRVCDLGCGTGELTKELHEHSRAKETVGIDNSAAMLKKALDYGSPSLVFRNQSIESFAASGEKFDLIF